MVEIPDSLRSVFSAPVRERDGSYIIEVPSGEIEHEVLTLDDTYRIAIFESPTAPSSSNKNTSRPNRPQSSSDRGPPGPPVDEGEVREVTIETVGDQGDGIAKVEQGYVVIVPDTQPGEQPTVEIDQVQENVAFASLVERDSRAR